MASPDEPAEERLEVKSQALSWQPADPLVVHADAREKHTPSKMDWVKSAFGMFGRGAPA